MPPISNFFPVHPEHQAAGFIEDSESLLMVSLPISNFTQMVNYPVVVEMWDKKNFGRVKREFLKEFEEQERAKAGRWYRKFYQWHLQTGTPQRVVLHPDTLVFLVRLCNFFGQI